MATSLIFEFGFEAPEPQEPAEADQPMRILVLGDFSARASRGLENAADLGKRAVRHVDLDNFDATIAQLAPALTLALADGPAELRFGDLDDFHPDQLYQKADYFQALHGQRQRLKNPATFAAAAAVLQPGAATPAPSAAAPGATAAAEDAGDPFASLLGGTIKRAPAPAAGAPDVNALIRNLVGQLPPGVDPRQSEYVAAADAVIGERMRELLHAPAFQQLEAAWRGLHLLVTGMELDEQLQLHIVDVSKAELLADLSAAGGDLQKSGLYRLLVDQPRRSPDSAPWSVVAGNYSFGGSEDDIGLLSAIGAIAAQAGAPFIGTAQDSLLGTASLAAQPDPSDWSAPDADQAARWQALRTSPQAVSIGLALPRVLLRLPYGKATDSIDQFDFEEADASHAHEDYLWGHASLACALLLGRAFEQNGWEMSAADELDLADLPAHTVRRDGNAGMQACAEAYLSERAGDAILKQGLMPLLSFKNRPAVRLLRSQSIALPAQALAGPWAN
ncbi:MAG: type VI secretion system contractile sheath large subunit [Pseudomonadota bacterium]